MTELELSVLDALQSIHNNVLDKIMIFFYHVGRNRCSLDFVGNCFTFLQKIQEERLDSSFLPAGWCPVGQCTSEKHCSPDPAL